MIGPIILTADKKFFYVGCINSIYKINFTEKEMHTNEILMSEIITKGKFIIEINFKITGLKIENNFLIIFGRSNLQTYDLTLNNNVDGQFTKFMISDAIFYAKNFLVTTFCGKILKNQKILHDFQCKSVVFMKLCENFVILGSFNLTLIRYQNKTSKVEIHKGRVFDVEINKYGFVSAGEDRKVVIIDSRGLYIIQELRCYIVKVGIFKSYIYTVDKNGKFKLYHNRNLVFCDYFGTLSVQSILLKHNCLFIGLSNGIIKKIKLHDDFGEEVKYETYIKILENKFANLNTEYFEVKTESHVEPVVVKKVSIENELVIGIQKCNILMPKIYKCLLTENKITILFENLIEKEYFIKKPNFYKQNLVGTKNGLIVINTQALKICADSILKMKKLKKIYICTTKDKKYFIKLGSTNLNTKNIKGSIKNENRMENIYETKNFKLLYRPLNQNKIFREISCASEYKNFFVCGTLDNKIALICKNLILDCLSVNGQVSSICKSKKYIFVSIKNGIIYIVKIVKKKLYFVSEIKSKLKIIDLCYKKYLYIIDSGGNILKLIDNNRNNTEIYDYKRFILVQVKSFNKYLTRIKIYKSTIYCTTSDGELILYNEKNKNTIIYKLLNGSITNIFLYKKIIYLVSENHLLCEVNFRNQVFNKILAHSSQIKDVIKKDKMIYTISLDKRLCVYTTCLVKVKEYDIFIDSPSSIILQNQVCYVFGIGIQKINL